MRCHCGQVDDAIHGHEYGDGPYCQDGRVGTGDDYYQDLKGALERLCRAQTFAPMTDKPVLQRAIDSVKHVGMQLPQWSPHDRPLPKSTLDGHGQNGDA